MQANGSSSSWKKKLTVRSIQAYTWRVSHGFTQRFLFNFESLVDLTQMYNYCFFCLTKNLGLLYLFLTMSHEEAKLSFHTN